MINITDLLNNFFLNRLSEINSRAQKDAFEATINQRILLLIVNDFENEHSLGKKNPNGWIRYESKAIASKLSLSETDVSDQLYQCVEILKGFGFQAGKDYDRHSKDNNIVYFLEIKPLPQKQNI